MVELIVDKQQSGAAVKGVPAGFKLTAVGVIPQDWEVVPFFDVVSIVSGQVSPICEPYSSMILIAPDHIETGTGRLISTQSAKEQNAISGKYIFHSGDTIYSKIRPYLRKAIYADFDGLCSADMYPLRPKEGIEPKYILPLVLGNRFSKYAESVSVRSGIPKINRTEIADFLFVIPSQREEQTAIANVLFDTEALITALEQLIAKKQAIKTATMQQLLTGKIRLPQFALRDDGAAKGYKKSEAGNIPEDWYTSTILDIVTHIIDYRGRTPKKLGMDWGNGNIVALSAGNVKKGYIDFLSECYFGSDELYNRWMTSGTPKRNDIVFTMEAPLGNAALIPDDKKYILSQRTILLQINEERFTPIFILQVLLSDFFQSYIYDCATGSTAQGIKRSIFEKLYIAAPKNREEQTAIASILSDMDKDIQTLQQRLDKTRQLKQGMMQELLTGKTRLIERN
ncbi:restriction endonuclease subunit S [Dickeya dianthicola]|uniref:restriction endonuclease subunit S n=1 Tax=Dickeya dianthicola TaxID=204039 RepID=UPI000401DD89|nr:restriction endonuclease subunit S [Dickeya dianthicola]MCI4031314.1 restriction endonuclease subunit S [Dickeya dianthicola]MCI4173723.1 restriction endonuclease subunit S [Dickeya dianthicola]MCI4179667.1 restriction endonuclease subunit S [Dickeya dianthicola]MCI4181633.1 restriction endonuclease subunit S [Dickeya dianthicola]MCI4192844.1 restriction endonuclease subunit S [Dickeya dianthicola]